MTERDEDGISDELARALNRRQSRKVRRNIRQTDSRVLVVRRENGPIVVYASGLRTDPLWGVWTRRGTYCDDRPVSVGTLSSLLAKGEADTVGAESLSTSVSGVFDRGGKV